MANSYYLYQRYISYDGQDFYPAYPAEYSIDADGTQPKVIRLQNDPQCGTPDPDAIYRWFELYPNEYVCENYTKYKKLYRQVSYNNGITWATIMPYETMKGDIIEGLSTDCGFQGTQERWVTLPADDYICADCETQEPDEPTPPPTPSGEYVLLFDDTMSDTMSGTLPSKKSDTCFSTYIINEYIKDGKVYNYIENPTASGYDSRYYKVGMVSVVNPPGRGTLYLTVCCIEDNPPVNMQVITITNKNGDTITLTLTN